ncbi:MMPL family transporter [Streptomyces xantholiticus]|uniref:MMPL family transporter n=1 Tax=Streptomyces xantholiticus TaxID=68285 RepID=UPI0019C8DFF4|nr:MMPL family transporter [Streptomyces xantholiticus]GGW36889.1 hypothetical protein GCM10010381_21940 [Streptomyces xantholiticus]
MFRIDPPHTTGYGTRLALLPTQEAMRGDVPAFVERIRAVPTAPEGVLVGGYPAETTDFRSTLLDRLPVVVALILSATFVILFLMTGSLLLPAKATVLNLLSLSVMFGCLVFVFQEGHFSSLLGFTPTGSVEPSMPVLMFCVAYGLSMDYEVFLLARIKEEHERTGDTERAVSEGIRRSAPLVTAAAGILSLTFASYATGGVVFLKETRDRHGPGDPGRRHPDQGRPAARRHAARRARQLVGPAPAAPPARPGRDLGGRRPRARTPQGVRVIATHG